MQTAEDINEQLRRERMMLETKHKMQREVGETMAYRQGYEAGCDANKFSTLLTGIVCGAISVTLYVVAYVTFFH